MKQEGLKHISFPSKRDAHPKKGFINWWEIVMDGNSPQKYDLINGSYVVRL